MPPVAPKESPAAKDPAPPIVPPTDAVPQIPGSNNAGTDPTAPKVANVPGTSDPLTSAPKVVDPKVTGDGTKTATDVADPKATGTAAPEPQAPSVSDILENKVDPKNVATAPKVDETAQAAATQPGKQDLGDVLKNNAANPNLLPPADPNDPFKQDKGRPENNGIQQTRPGETNGQSIGGNVDTSSSLVPRSTAEGQRLLNLLPLLPGYDNLIIRNLPSGTPVVVMQLRVACGEYCQSRSHPKRQEFETIFSDDIIAALDKYKLTREKIPILNVLEATGRAAIQIAFLPLDDGTSPYDIVRELYSQLVVDSGSKLRNKGSLTPALDPNVFGSNTITPVKSDTKVDTNPKMQTGVIIGISIGAYVGLMVAFFFGYRTYVRRVKNDEADQAKNAEQSAWFYKSLRVDPGENFAEFDSLLESELQDGASFIDGVTAAPDGDPRKMWMQSMSAYSETEGSRSRGTSRIQSTVAPFSAYHGDGALTLTSAINPAHMLPPQAFEDELHSPV